jgi:hypothetical protein
LIDDIRYLPKTVSFLAPRLRRLRAETRSLSGHATGRSAAQEDYSVSRTVRREPTRDTSFGSSPGSQCSKKRNNAASVRIRVDELFRSSFDPD